MNTVSMKVNVPSSREIMGKKAETLVNYGQDLSNIEVADDCCGSILIDDAVENVMDKCPLSGPAITFCEATGQSCP